jgi:hypothetical protein
VSGPRAVKSRKTVSLDNRVFVPVENTENGVVSGKTRFHFWQQGVVFYADYFGGDVREGHIIGKFNAEGQGEMLYHCLTTDQDLKAGKAIADFIETDTGGLAMELQWQWISGDGTQGRSRYEEVTEKEMMKWATP